MKALKCEMCSGNDIVKQDGLYVCQFCGTKYTVDEAKKLMIDGEIEVKGILTPEKIAQNGETLLKLGRFEQAKNVFHRLSCDHPEDYRGWWGMALAESSLKPDSPEISEYIKAALTVADDEAKKQIEEEGGRLLKKQGKTIKALSGKAGKGNKVFFIILLVLFLILTLAAALVTLRLLFSTGTACVDSYRNGFDFDWFKPSLLTIVSLAATLLFGLIARIFKKKLS